MTLQIGISEVIGLCISLIGAFWALARMLMVQSQRHIEAQFKAISDALKVQADGTLHLERQLMELKAELPREYVRREDHTRTIASVMVSIDNLRLTVERVILEGRKT